jgi:hypothetical protein
MQLNIGRFSKSMLKANYTLIMVLSDALGTRVYMTSCTGGTVVGILLPSALQGIHISWKWKAALPIFPYFAIQKNIGGSLNF